jgi:hypothetical protein
MLNVILSEGKDVNIREKEMLSSMKKENQELS